MARMAEEVTLRMSRLSGRLETVHFKARGNVATSAVRMNASQFLVALGGHPKLKKLSEN